MEQRIYKGRGTDIKPLNAPVGSIFIEEDTGDIWVKGTSSRVNNGWQESQLNLAALLVAVAGDGFLKDASAVAAGFVKSSGTTGGTLSAGAGNQYVEIDVNGTVYKVLHDGTV